VELSTQSDPDDFVTSVFRIPSNSDFSVPISAFTYSPYVREIHRTGSRPEDRQFKIALRGVFVDPDDPAESFQLRPIIVQDQDGPLVTVGPTVVDVDGMDGVPHASFRAMAQSARMMARDDGEPNDDLTPLVGTLHVLRDVCRFRNMVFLVAPCKYRPHCSGTKSSACAGGIAAIRRWSKWGQKQHHQQTTTLRVVFFVFVGAIAVVTTPRLYLFSSVRN
jgi:hypothetical protein